MVPPPTKRIDFPASADRHLADAKLLQIANRFANSGHLYGLGAECGIKALLVSHGLPTDVDGSPVDKKGFKVHVNSFAVTTTFTNLRVFLSGRSGAHYLAMIPSIGAFSDWDVSHRYFSEAAIPQSFANWKAAAEEVGRMMDQARIDGKL